MQRLGQVMNPRDERNWMIPRPGTKRRQVYDALVAGKRAGEIMKELNLTRKAYSDHRHFITCWENANLNKYAVRSGVKVRTMVRVGNEFVAA
jgi:FixJ family two-component response regulator